jgi:hypothetical protein
LPERIYEETKTLPEPQAREVLDFIGYLKHKGAAAPDSLSSSDGSDDDWAEFENLAGAWSGKFDREARNYRPILR